MEASIAKWEADIELHEKATGETVPEPHRRMSLEDMCPERLCALLRDQGPERFPTYDDMKLRISDWVADESSKGGAKPKAIGAVLAGEELYEHMEIWYPDEERWICGFAPKRARTDEGSSDKEMGSAEEAQKDGGGMGPKSKGKGGKK